MNEIKKSVILAAGLGSRLKPLTDEVPKCLTEINGKPIIKQEIEILEKNCIQETVVVVGYMGDVVINKIGFRYRNMKISYLWNKIYDETNTIYSAWLARKYLEDGAILIEGDTFFEEALVYKVLARDKDRTFWIADRFMPEYEGSMSIIDKNSRIVEIRIVRGQLAQYKDNYYKSTGILKITSEYGKKFSQWLDEEVKKGNVNIYYDLVIAKHLHDYPIYVYDVTGLKWAELDSLEDLKRAEKIFTSEICNSNNRRSC